MTAGLTLDQTLARVMQDVQTLKARLIQTLQHLVTPQEMQDQIAVVLPDGQTGVDFPALLRKKMDERPHHALLAIHLAFELTAAASVADHLLQQKQQAIVVAKDLMR